MSDVKDVDEDELRGLAARGTPKASFVQKLKGQGPTLYCIYEDKFYANQFNPTSSQENAEDIDTKNFSYFIIFAPIGVGSLTKKDTIRNVHFELTFEAVSPDFPPIEIRRLLPSDEKKVIGVISGKEHKIAESGIGVKGGAGAEFDNPIIKANLGVEGNIKRGNNSEVIRSYSYDDAVEISSSKGAGNIAIWDFKQGEAAGSQGQYHLNVFFRLRKTAKVIAGEGAYQVIPKIIINDKKIEIDEKGNELTPKPLDFIV